MSRLWRRWEDPFPGKSFNRFHSVVCTIHNYVHLYHMAGRMSEERNGAYNGTLNDIKTTLQYMPPHIRRINKVAERSQGDLKGGVLESRLVIQKVKKSRRLGPRKYKALDQDGRAVRIMTEEYNKVNGESYVVLNSGNLSR